MNSTIGNLQRQRGYILIVVLIVVAIATTMAAQMAFDSGISERRQANRIDSDRAYQFVLGAEEFAKGILKRYFEAANQETINLSQPWARGPMVFPIEGGTLMGELEDLSSCFNLNSLAGDGEGREGGESETPEPQFGPSEREPGPEAGAPRAESEVLTPQEQFEKLVEPLVIDFNVAPQELAAALKDWVDTDSELTPPYGAEDFTYLSLEKPYRAGNTLLGHKSELLTIAGFTPKIYRKISDYVCALPVASTRININTIPVERAELIWMQMKNIPLSSVQEAIGQRPEEGFGSVDEFLKLLPIDPTQGVNATALSVDSEYFLLRSMATVGRGQARLNSVLRKENNNEFRVVARHLGDS